MQSSDGQNPGNRRFRNEETRMRVDHEEANVLMDLPEGRCVRTQEFADDGFSRRFHRLVVIILSQDVVVSIFDSFYE